MSRLFCLWFGLLVRLFRFSTLATAPLAPSSLKTTPVASSSCSAQTRSPSPRSAVSSPNLSSATHCIFNTGGFRELIQSLPSVTRRYASGPAVESAKQGAKGRIKMGLCARPYGPPGGGGFGKHITGRKSHTSNPIDLIRASPLLFVTIPSRSSCWMPRSFEFVPCNSSVPNSSFLPLPAKCHCRLRYRVAGAGIG